MLKRGLKFFLVFVFCFLLLSIPINGRTLFSHIFSHSSHYSNMFFYSLKNRFVTTIDLAKEYTKKLFVVSPPQDEISDSVDSSYSSIKKDIPWEEYTDEEKELLRKILSESNKEESNTETGNNF